MTALAARPAAAPLSHDEFAALMAGLGPFEDRPRLAVGVSGGADSMALALLADRWARERNGAVVALTVDHGLRPGSAEEAAQVAGWLAARRIEQHVLDWHGAKPSAGLQAAARAARRALLVGHCRTHGILHLLLGHHQDDQRETQIMRQAARSGRDGLAGMAAVVETADLRILRPFLRLERQRLAATLDALGQPWVEDPSNRDPRFTRARVRAAGTVADLRLGAAADFGRERAAREIEVADLLARAAAIYPEGWATLDAGVVETAPPEIGRRALARVLMTVGGGAYPPRGERLDRLCAAVRDRAIDGGRTLGGCRIVRWRGRLLIARELASVGPGATVMPAEDTEWDGRFVARSHGPRTASALRIEALGEAGWAALAAAHNRLRLLPIPSVVRPTLPAIYDLDGVREVPHLLYRRQGADPDSVGSVSVVFRPRHLLAGAGFAVSSPSRR